MDGLKKGEKQNRKCLIRNLNHGHGKRSGEWLLGWGEEDGGEKVPLPLPRRGRASPR